MKIVIAGRYDRHNDSGAAARLYVAYSLEEYQAGNESEAVPADWKIGQMMPIRSLMSDMLWRRQ